MDLRQLLATDWARQAPVENNKAETAANSGTELEIVGGSPANQSEGEVRCWLCRKKCLGLGNKAGRLVIPFVWATSRQPRTKKKRPGAHVIIFFSYAGQLLGGVTGRRPRGPRIVRFFRWI